jgi:hypothetical protein
MCRQRPVTAPQPQFSKIKIVREFSALKSRDSEGRQPIVPTAFAAVTLMRQRDVTGLVIRSGASSETRLKRACPITIDGRS